MRYSVKYKEYYATMKNTKSNRLILAFVAIVMFIASAFTIFTSNNSAKAAPSSLSFLGGTAYDSATLDSAESAVKVKVKDGQNLSFDYELAIDDFKMQFALSSDVTSAKIELTSLSKYASGVVVNGKLVKDVVNTFTFNNASDTDYTLAINVDGNTVKTNVNGTVTFGQREINAFGIPSAKMNIIFSVKDGAEGTVTLKSVDQKASDSTAKYKQTFEVDNGAIKNFALPRVQVDADFIQNGVALNGKIYDVTFYPYCIAKSYNDADFYVEAGACANDCNIWIGNATNPDDIQFNKPEGNNSSMTFNVCVGKDEDKVILTSQNVTVMDVEKDTSIPAYVSNSNIMNLYKEAVAKACFKQYGDETYHIPLGSKYAVPSMKDIVRDNVTAYEELGVTVYYRTPETSGKATSMQIPTDGAGKYLFYVVFEDEAGNTMNADDFFVVDDHNPDVFDKGPLYDYVFEFYLEDDAPVTIEAPSTQEKGTVGKSYTATNFTIDGTTDIAESNNHLEYKLFYNANAEAKAFDDGWVEIKRASEATESSDKLIAFNGKLTFTPDKEGAYMIECKATSYSKVHSASARTIVVVEKDEEAVIETSNWFVDNIWSVVFLSIGTLCLIAVVILLFIKPKEENEAQEKSEK